MSNSSLAKVKVPANTANYTKGRSYKISKITVHHMAGILTAKRCGQVFQARNRGASAHYGIGSDGKIGLYVDEKNAAWADANRTSNHKSVTIEVANSSLGGQYPVSKKSLELLIKLVADIAKRNNLGKLVPGKNLTWHSMYANTTCCGNYLRSQMNYIAQEANELLAGLEEKDEVSTKKELYRVRKSWKDSKSQLGAFNSLSSAKKLAKKNRGYEVYNSLGKCVYNPWTTTSTAKKYSGTFPKLPSRGYFKKGDTGIQVKRLQKFLNWFGGYGLVIDGEIGDKTISAVGKFQSATGLVVDKKFGAKSLAKAKTVKK